MVMHLTVCPSCSFLLPGHLTSVSDYLAMEILQAGRAEGCHILHRVGHSCCCALRLTCCFHTPLQESWRFTHNRDLVPSWPPTWVGFHHLAREVWQVDFGAAGVRQ